MINGSVLCNIRAHTGRVNVRQILCQQLTRNYGIETTPQLGGSILCDACYHKDQERYRSVCWMWNVDTHTLRAYIEKGCRVKYDKYLSKKKENELFVCSC